MKFGMLLAATAGALALAGVAQASTQLNGNVGTPELLAGSGIPDGNFVIDSRGGIELGLRGRERFELPTASTGRLYQFALGQQASFDFSFNSGGADLTGLSSLLTITRLGDGGTAALDPLLIPDNGVGGNFEQNSEYLGFGFLNGSPIFNVGDINYDLNQDATYKLTWTVNTTNGGTLTNFIYVQQGAGSGAVPEPATWAMMLAGFGGLGAMLRRRRSLALAA